MKFHRYLTVVVIVVLTPFLYAAETVIESKHSLPLAYDVDVVVAGGSLVGI